MTAEAKSVDTKPHVGTLIDYQVDWYPLAPCVAMALDVMPRSLPILDRIAERQYALFSRDNDQSTEFHRLFYTRFADYVEPTYKRLVADVIRPLYSEAIAYQRIPTFRVHLPGNVAVGEFHRDRDYQHSPYEENYWLPFTETFGTNAMWVESAPGRGDYAPVALGYGQILRFDGANLRHGNRQNETDLTRVSMDFRVIPMSKYEDTDRVTINTHMRFAIGDYFSEMR